MERELVSLDDRLVAEEGSFYLPAMQALVRLPLDQARRDAANGLRIGTFISGYPGSPLAGYDLALERHKDLLSRWGVIHRPGANEELAMTAITGTQMLDHYPHSNFDGVAAFWYGKGPGMDRSGDALRHGNFAGTSRYGSVVLLSGEDHEAKSSTMPHQQDYMYQSVGVPILYPSDIRSLLELGAHAVAISRFSGCWVALKLVSALCDSGSTVHLDKGWPEIHLPDLVLDGHPFEKRDDFTFYPGKNIDIERHLFEERHAAVLAYSAANSLDRITVTGPKNRIGIITAGKSALDLRQALMDMGIDDDLLVDSGIAILELGMIYPLNSSIVSQFARGLELLIVIEEKRGFVETQVKEALFTNGVHSPVVIGKYDEYHRPLFPVEGGMSASLITERLAPTLLKYLTRPEVVQRRLAELEPLRRHKDSIQLKRTPNYCSGCPHSTSTKLAPGQVAWGSPGCHSFASVITQPERHIVAMTQFGGEGLPWIGLSPFTDRKHITQNVGDGSIFHSSYLNIRFCVAAGVDITFRILYNGYVANTGAQSPVGQRSVPELCRLLATEGVAHIAILTKHPKSYHPSELPEHTSVHSPVDVVEVAAFLEKKKGVTVLLYDESCANERRRRQKRGIEPPPLTFAYINEEVCEGCGDCGRVSNCMSLERVETEFGQKTRIHPSSCSQDFSCLQGDCPAFTTIKVRPGGGYAKPRPPQLSLSELPSPNDQVRPVGPYRVILPGVGGTGVITVNAVLSTAAFLDGWQVDSYDQTGAAQKWGQVLSSLVLTPLSGYPLSIGSSPSPGLVPPVSVSPDVGIAKADLCIALDLVSSVDPSNLDRCNPAKTSVVANSGTFLTGELVRDISKPMPDELMLDELSRVAKGGAIHGVDALSLSEDLFGDHMMANFICVGVAWQAGFLPMSAEAIEEAIRLNGTLVDKNIQAFRYGRLFVHDRSRLEEILAGTNPYGKYSSRSRRTRVPVLNDAAGGVGTSSSAQAAPGSTSAPGSRDRDNREISSLVLQDADPLKRALADSLANLSPAQRDAYGRLLPRVGVFGSAEVAAKIELRIAELIAYQSVSYAEEYLKFLEHVHEREQSVTPGRYEIQAAAAFSLFKLMAYKDEYEVARLYLKPRFRQQLQATFSSPRHVTYHLHPPLLRAMGMNRKIELGEWFDPAFRVLKAMRRLRGTSLDIFGRTELRRLERSLPEWYKNSLDRALKRLDQLNYALVVEIAQVPDLIRGYESIKLAAIARAKDRMGVLLEQIEGEPVVLARGNR